MARRAGPHFHGTAASLCAELGPNTDPSLRTFGFNKTIKQLLLDAGIQSRSNSNGILWSSDAKSRVNNPVSVVEPANTDGAESANIFTRFTLPAQPNRSLFRSRPRFLMRLKGQAFESTLIAAPVFAALARSGCCAGKSGWKIKRRLIPPILPPGESSACQAHCLEDVTIDA